MTSLRTGATPDVASEALRILFVEDSETDAKLIALELRRTLGESHSLRVDNAASMRSALEAGTWDVIICDWSMPGFSALGAMDLIKTMGLDIPLIIVSGTIGEDVAVDAMRAGASDYVLKNKLARLTPAVEREVRESRARSVSLRNRDALRASEARFARLVEMDIVGIVTADVNANLIDANDSFLRMVGYSREDLIAGRLTFRELTPPEWWEGDRAALAQLKRTGMTALREKEYLHKEGTRVPVMLGGALVDESTIMVFVLDITERKRMEASESQNRRYEEASRVRSLFLANMSHELRTPLNGILGFSELLLDEAAGPVSSQQKDFLGNIVKSGRHLLTLIVDLLDMAKIEAGKLELRPEPLDLAQLVGEVCGVVRPAALAQRILVEISIDDRIGQLVLDPARLRQVLYNYLSNALKFTPDGGRVAVRARPEAVNTFRLEVEDSGIGIAEADIGRLFSEFHQLEAGAKKQGGSGLGLALTKRIVEAQGGHVGVTSEVGKGANFFAVLPLAGGTVPVHP